MLEGRSFSLITDQSELPGLTTCLVRLVPASHSSALQSQFNTTPMRTLLVFLIVPAICLAGSLFGYDTKEISDPIKKAGVAVKKEIDKIPSYLNPFGSEDKNTAVGSSTTQVPKDKIPEEEGPTTTEEPEQAPGIFRG